eukprot:m.53418 g.53418  ORF g.53418 m.53418 type:complete len:247 (+) comp34249_c0_seq1:646-1386(+)
MSPSRETESDVEEEKSPSSTMTRIDILKTKQFYVILIGRTGMLLPAYGLLARQQDFLEYVWIGREQTASVPIHELAFIISFVYLLGRFVWLNADKCTIKGAWIIATSMQVVAFGFLPYLGQISAPFSKYVAIFAYGVINLAFPATKGTVSAMCSIVYGPENTGTAWGLVELSMSVAGIAGPLIMEKMYLISGGSFSTYLYFGAGISVVALLLALAITPLKPSTRISKKRVQNYRSTDDFDSGIQNN